MTRSPQRSAHSRSARKGRRPSGFTLVELLAVVAVIVVMTGLSIPAFNAIRGGTDFTSEVYDIAGMLEQARTYAVANNTYVLAGITEVSGAQDTSVTPQASGTGRIAMAIIASKSGLRPYQGLINQSLMDPTALSGWSTSNVSGYGSGAGFIAVTNLATFQNIHLVDLQNSTSGPPASGSPMARPTVTAYYNLSNADGTSSTQFAWPLGARLSPITAIPRPQYEFASVIEFDPQGSARIISANNTASLPDATPQFLEIGLQPVHGPLAAGPPASQAVDPGQIAAIQIDGISGSVHIYRP